MTRPAYDAAKLARFALDLDERQAALRGLATLYSEGREHASNLTQALISGAHSGYLGAIWNGRDVNDLAALPDAELAQARVDLGTLRAAVAQRERLTELRRRHDTLAADIAPLAQLVARLNAYIEGNQ